MFKTLFKESQSPLTGHMHSYNRLTVYSYEIGVLSQSPLTSHMHSYGWSHPVFTAGWVDNVSIPSNGSYAFLLKHGHFHEIKKLELVSIPSNGSYAFLHYRMVATFEIPTEVSIPSNGSYAFLQQAYCLLL